MIYFLSGLKIRKLEFLVADALNRGCDNIITCGGIQSNHARATAVTAAQLGLKPHLVLRTKTPTVCSFFASATYTYTQDFIVLLLHLSLSLGHSHFSRRLKLTCILPFAQSWGDLIVFLSKLAQAIL